MSYRDLRRADDLFEEMGTTVPVTSEQARRRAAYLVTSTPTKAAKRAVELRDTPDPQPDQVEERVAIEAALSTAARCSECGRALEDPVSVVRGIGPDCARGTA